MTACADERLRLDWHSPTVTGVKPGSGSTLLPSGRVLARALTATCFSAGADGQFGVGASDQLRRAVLCLKRCKSNLDLARIRLGRERRLDDVEAVLSILDRGAGHHAQKLVAADPNDQIIGAQMTADAVHCALQQRVTRGMTLRVVDGLQADDVDVGQPRAGPSFCGHVRSPDQCAPS